MRAQLGEIEWLDKVKQNFSEDQFYKDMAQSEENTLSRAYQDSMVYGSATVTLSSGSYGIASSSGSILASSGNGDYSLGYTSPNLSFSNPPIPAQILNTTGPIRIHETQGSWYAYSETGELCSVTFEDGQTFSTNSMSYVRIR